MSAPPPPRPHWLLVWGAVTLRLGFPGGARSLAVSDEVHSVERPSKRGGTGPGRQPQRQRWEGNAWLGPQPSVASVSMMSERRN